MLKRPVWLPTVLILFCTALLIKHTSPTLNLGDAGEFIASGYTLGVCHPPGYPLYALTGRLFTLLPLGSIGWRINLASTLAGGLTLTGLYLVMLSLGESGIIASLTVIMGLAGGLFLEQALAAEIYILHAGVILLLFYLLSRGKPNWTLLAFVIGLGFGVHYLILTFVPLFLSQLVFSGDLKKRSGRFWFKLFLATLLGLTCFTYLVLRASKGPPVNWGSPDNWERLLVHLKREQYKVLEFSQRVSWRDKWLFAKELGGQIGRQYYFLLILLVPGAFAVYQKPRKYWPLVLFLGLAGPGLILMLQFQFEDLNLSRLQEYYLPAFMALVIIMGLGLSQSRRWLPGKNLWLLGSLSLALTMLALGRNLPLASQRQNWLGYDFGRNMLISLPPHAVFFTEGDNKTTPFCYTVSVEGRRPDLIIFDRGRNLFYDIFQAYQDISQRGGPITNEQIEKYLVDYYSGSRSVVYSLRPEENKFPAYKISDYGFFTLVLRPAIPKPEALLPFRYFNYRFRQEEEKFTDYLSQDVIANYYFHLGSAYIELGQIDKAGDFFVSLNKRGGRLKHVHNNLGVLLKRYGYWIAADAEFKKALYLDPNYTEAAFNLAQITENIDKKQAVIRWRYYLKIAAGNPDEAPYINLAHKHLQKLQTDQRSREPGK